MGTTVSTTIGVGFAIPEDILDKLPGDGLWEIFKEGDYKLIGYRSSYFYDYGEPNAYIYVKRLTKTFYGVGFQDLPDEFLNLSVIVLTDEEWAEIQKLTTPLGIGGGLGRFVETSVG